MCALAEMLNLSTRCRDIHLVDMTRDGNLNDPRQFDWGRPNIARVVLDLTGNLPKERQNARHSAHDSGHHGRK